MTNRNYYQEIVTLATQLVDRPDAESVLGVDYGEELAEQTVYRSLTLSDDQEKATINLTPDEMRPPFEWVVEITTWGRLNVHILLYPDGRMVEAYGHKLFDLEPAPAVELIQMLNDLSGS
jgi:hypothetical protein